MFSTVSSHTDRHKQRPSRGQTMLSCVFTSLKVCKKVETRLVQTRASQLGVFRGCSTLQRWQKIGRTRIIPSKRQHYCTVLLVRSDVGWRKNFCPPKKLVQNFFFAAQKMLGPKKFWIKKINCVQQKFWVKKKFGSKMIYVNLGRPKNFGS